VPTEKLQAEIETRYCRKEKVKKSFIFSRPSTVSQQQHPVQPVVSSSSNNSSLFASFNSPPSSKPHRQQDLSPSMPTHAKIDPFSNCNSTSGAVVPTFADFSAANFDSQTAAAAGKKGTKMEKLSFAPLTGHWVSFFQLFSLFFSV
jgi:hypothetical protein